MSMHAVDDYADLIATSGAIGFLTKSELSRETIEELVRNVGWAGDGTNS